MQKIQYQKTTWLDFKKPDKDDALYLKKNFSLHPLTVEEFTNPTFRPKATHHESYLFLTIHIPLFNSKDRTTYPGELDIILTQDHLITGHNGDFFQLEQFFNKLKEHEEEKALYMNQNPAYLLYNILEILLNACFPKLDHIIQNINKIENAVFAGNEKAMVKEISIVKRDILNFRRVIKPQRSVIESIVQNNSDFISKDLSFYYLDLVGTNIRIWNALENSKETIESLEETNNSLLSNKLNTTMKMLTIFNAILLPITVYAGIISMNSANIPLSQNPNAFWIHLILMFSISLFTFIFFKFKKWY